MSGSNYIATPAHGAAWVTGASSGIGLHLALELARDGWQVAVTARSAGALEELKAEAAGCSGAIHVFPGDVRDTEQMAAHGQAIAAGHGGLALVVANAGVYLPQDGLRGSADAYRTTFDVNLMGTVNVVLPAIEVMKPAGRGQIAIVSSVAGYRGLPTSAAYGASKAGLFNLAESLRFDLEPAGIRIQVISPGFVDTPATRNNPFPMPHLIQPEDAVAEILCGLQQPGSFEISFPKRFVHQLKAAQLLPFGLYYKLLRKTTGWDKKSGT